LRAGEAIKPSLGSVDVRVLLDRCKTLLEGALPSAASPDVALTTQVADGIQGQIITDRCWLWQMTMSYLTNAYKFTHTGEIKLVVGLAGSQNGRFLRFEVHDTGIGVEAAQRDSLFVPWNGNRGGSSTAHARAVGAARLGLYSVKVKSEQLGGSCGYEPKAAPEQGSVFYFQVPYIPEGQRFENQFERMQHMASNAIIKGAESDSLLATAGAAAGSDTAAAGADGVTAAAAGVQPSATVPAAAASSSAAAKPKLSALQRSMQAARTQATTAGAADGAAANSSSNSSSAAIQRQLSGVSTDTATTTESESSTAAAAADTAAEAAVATGPTALVIDDTGSVRKLLCKTLEGKGLRCDVARNGLEGLHMMRCKRYSVVLCDAFMPVMGGMECIQRFRQWEESHLTSTTSTNTSNTDTSNTSITTDASSAAAATADGDATGTSTTTAANASSSSSSSSSELRTQRQFIVGISSYLEGFDRDSSAIDAFLSKPIDLKWLRELLRIAMATQENVAAGGGPFVMAPSDAKLLAENGASSNAL
jgi:CheY-like chemotaxis protein